MADRSRETTMAKSAFPMKTGSGLLAKVVGALVAVTVVALVVKHPADAASAVTGLFHLVSHVVDGVSSFLGQIAR